MSLQVTGALNILRSVAGFMAQDRPIKQGQLGSSPSNCCLSMIYGPLLLQVAPGASHCLQVESQDAICS